MGLFVFPVPRGKKKKWPPRLGDKNNKLLTGIGNYKRKKTKKLVEVARRVFFCD